MPDRRPVALAAAALLLLTACGGGGGEPSGDAVDVDPDVVARQPDDAAVAAAADANAFGRRLHVELARADGAEANVVTSPFSAAAALALIAGGAEGTTAEELVAVLGLDAVQDERWAALLTEVAASADADVTVANAVFVDDRAELQPDFAAFARDVLGATAETVDLGDQSGADAIDAWVRESTEDLIDGIAEDLRLPNGQATAVLANAVHFLGLWTTPFDPDDTRPGPFTTADGSVVEVPFMEHDGKSTEVPGIRLARTDRVTFVELSYGDGGTATMEVLLPADGVDPVALLDELGPDELAALSSEARQLGEILRLPRFEVAWSSPLDVALRTLGIEAAYGGGFGPMLVPDSYLSTVVQKTYLRVDEAGTEAAAVTAGVVEESMPEEIVVDRPFALVVRDGVTGAELFLGTIGDPSA